MTALNGAYIDTSPDGGVDDLTAPDGMDM